MTKKIENELLSYRISNEENKKQETIDLGIKTIGQNQLQRHSYLNLFLSTIRFISFKTWISQFLVLVLSVMMVFVHATKGTAFSLMMDSYMILLIFSILFFTDEIYKSFTSGMWMLEQSFKYDLRQHTLMKLLIFGIADFILIFCISLLSNATLAIPLIKILFYLLVPFNVFTIILFSTVTFWRNNMNRTVLWSVAGLIGAASIIIMNLWNIYEIAFSYWISGFIFTSSILMYVVYSQLRQIPKEG